MLKYSKVCFDYPFYDVHCMLVTDFFSVAIVFYNFFKVWVRIQTNLYKYTKFTYFFLVNIKCLDYWFIIYVNIPVKRTINKDPKKNMFLILDTINMLKTNLLWQPNPCVLP